MATRRNYAEKMNLAAMTPRNELASTKYCLANAGAEYLTYQPKADTAFTVELKAGTTKTIFVPMHTRIVNLQRPFLMTTGT